MPFEQKYDAATREAAVDRVLQRRATNPGDRSVLRVVSDEFNVGQQSLRAWVAAVEQAVTPPGEPAVGAAVGAAAEAAPSRRRRPRFSPVVTTRVERGDGQDPAVGAEPDSDVVVGEADVDVEAAWTPSPSLAPVPVPVPLPAATRERPAAPGDPVAALEAEAARLRRGNEALKEAMRALLGS